MILTIYEDVKYDQSPSWIFSKGVSLLFWVTISNFFKNFIVELDLEIMFVDIFE